jgi:hypothetical protein
VSCRVVSCACTACALRQARACRVCGMRAAA